MEDTCNRESSCQVSLASLEDLAALWRDPMAALQWTCPFVLPPWLSSWWSVFGRGAQPLIVVVRERRAIIGIAPLMLQGKTVRFLGDPDVCDYFDCIVVQGKERLFFTTLLAHLTAQGLGELDLGLLRPDASIRMFLPDIESNGAVQWCTEQEDVFSELDLPATWDELLGKLDGKQRHELRRKLRRLHDAGSVEFRRVDNMTQLPAAVDTFLSLFTMNREDKAEFMTDAMASFFQALCLSLGKEGLLRLFFLDLDGRPVASVFCFDYQGTRYLYNNGYDAAYQELGVGLMSKVLSLKAAIDDGLGSYNFLKGGEVYKYRLGGKAIPLWRCHATLF